ncbi:MAG TPA: MFS transporter [Polyangiaceae bacterium]|jgi:MFS family permease
MKRAAAPGTPRAAAGAHRRVSLLLFAAGWGANHFSSLLIVYRKSLGFSPASVALLFGAYAIGLVPGLLFAGHASDRLGRRAIVLPAGVAAIVGSGLLMLGGQGFGVLFAGRLVYGLAMGAIMSPGSVWVQELSEPGVGPRRATLALSAGFGVGPLATGVLAEFAPAPMVLPFVAHVLVMAASLAGVHAVPETAALALARPPREAPEKRARAGIGRRELAVLAGLLPAAPWAFGFAAASLAVLPGIMRSHVSRPILYSAFVILLTLLAGVLVQPLTARLRRRGNVVGLALGSLGLLVGACSVAVASPALVFAAAILTGVGYGLVMTTGLREVAERATDETRGTAVGIYYVLTYIGFALPFVHAKAATALGDVATLELTAAAAAGCLVLRGVVESVRG